MSHVTLGYLNLKDKTLARQPALRRASKPLDEPFFLFNSIFAET